MIRVVVEIQVKDGKKLEFLNIAQNLVAESRKEKGCIEYNLIDSGIENQLYFVEKWETMEDLKNHAAAPHSKKYGELLKELKEVELPVEVYETEKRDSIIKRRSIRNYTNDIVSNDIVDRIIRAGMFAPSAGNQQGWEFVVIRNRKMLDDLAKMSPYATPLNKANIAILILGNKNFELMQDILNTTEIEYFSLSRTLFSEPDLINKWMTNEKQRSKCVSCNHCWDTFPNSCILKAKK
ncbi:antibiotic biosynthesis monooxygenase [Cetobacterium sp.]|uniref:antibiotic biosynthesis monooxygenase n=1 Tax=Cetobacterium sp. TaxID=2071632 RepID=UPI003F41B35B